MKEKNAILENFEVTKLGPLPSDWEVELLKNLNSEVKTGLNPGDYPDEVFEYYSIPAYQNNRTPALEKGSTIRSQKTLLKNKAVLFGKLNPRVEKVWMVQSNSHHRKIGSTEWIPIFPRDDKVYPDYLYYVEWSRYVMPVAKTLVSGSTPSRQRVDPKSFNQIMVPLPPLPEQKKIAYVLSCVQEAKEKTEAVIEAAKELKKSLMKHLFTYGPVSLEEAEKVPLKETEIGLVPENWPVRKLDDLVVVKGGKRLPKGHKFAEIPPRFPYIRVIDFADWSVNPSSVKCLKPNDASILKRYIITADDAYISIAGTIGKVGNVPQELDGANLTENAARLIVKNRHELDKHFLIASLASEKGQREIHLRTSKTSQPKLALTRIREIPVPFPPINVQRRIANILSAANTKIQAEQNKKKALEELFKTLLDNLMTAKIRVNDLEL